MDWQRLGKHLLSSHGQVRRAFPPATMAAIGAAVGAVEQTHAGEIRFAVEDALDPWAVLRGQTARERAIEVFSTLRVWDTQHNTGVLIYVLLADHAVEIVADRGIDAQAGEATWSAICRRIEVAFAQSQYQAGALLAIDAVAEVLRQHFPQTSMPGNELPDEPVLL